MTSMVAVHAAPGDDQVSPHGAAASSTSTADCAGSGAHRTAGPIVAARRKAPTLGSSHRLPMRLVRFGSSNPLFKSHNFSRRNIVMAITGDDHEEAEEKERFADLIHRLDDDAEYAHKHAKGFKRYFTASVILNVLIFVGAQLIGIYAWPLTDPP